MFMFSEVCFCKTKGLVQLLWNLGLEHNSKTCNGLSNMRGLMNERIIIVFSKVTLFSGHGNLHCICPTPKQMFVVDIYTILSINV